MGNRLWKFGGGVALLVGCVAWLGMSGYEEGKAYYKTADEFVKLDAAAQRRPIRLMGNVAAGTIRHDEGKLAFSVTLNGATVPVLYAGQDPVPDTFKDGVEVLIEGRAGSEGRFVGKKIQAKCASKYEADPATAYRRGVGVGAAAAPAAAVAPKAPDATGGR